MFRRKEKDPKLSSSSSTRRPASRAMIPMIALLRKMTKHSWLMAETQKKTKISASPQSSRRVYPWLSLNLSITSDFHDSQPIIKATFHSHDARSLTRYSLIDTFCLVFCLRRRKLPGRISWIFIFSGGLSSPLCQQQHEWKLDRYKWDLVAMEIGSHGNANFFAMKILWIFFENIGIIYFFQKICGLFSGTRKNFEGKNW